MHHPEPAAVRLTGRHTALIARAAGPGDLPRAVSSLGLGGPRPVVTVIGGAGGLTGERLTRLEALVEALVPVVVERDAAVVDGGTDSGVMRLLGRARSASARCAGSGSFPAIGVAAIGTVSFPGHLGHHPGAAALDANHSHFVLVPGSEWGDEAHALAEVATLVAGGRPSATVLINGGDISFTDALRSVRSGRPVLVMRGSGRTADRIAAAADDPAGCADDRALELARHPMVHVVEEAASAAALRGLLRP